MRYDKRVQTPTMHHIDYGLGIVSRDVFDAMPADDASPTWPTRTGRLPSAGNWPGTRCTSASTRWVRSRDSRTCAASSPMVVPHTSRSSRELCSAVSGRSRRDYPGRWTATPSRPWWPCSPTARAAGGRLFILGVGGSAANASHAVNDFRKIVGIETYAPTDNVSELTARTNDEGWATVFAAWLTTSRISAATWC